jgi:lipid II isoglutaminyl synthase (glutamine-hydrolysing)
MISDNKFYFTHLYPEDMEIYGDYGNVLTMKYWVEKLGIEFIYQAINIGDSLPVRTDFYFFGGGQDAEQIKIYPDLLEKKDRLVDDLVNKNIAMLAICGGLQALGKEFITGEGNIIPGLDILPITTKALDLSVSSRAIGNVVIESEMLNCKLVGFENHSGQTYFEKEHSGFTESKPLGKVLFGQGNNYNEKIEGCVYKNIIATYMHGPCLPKNPEIVIYFLKKTINLSAKRLEVLQTFLSPTSPFQRAKLAIITKCL